MSQMSRGGGAKIAGGGAGLVQVLFLLVLNTYELPVVMLTRTEKGARYTRLVRLLFGLFFGSLAFSGFEALARRLGLKSTFDLAGYTGKNVSFYSVLTIFALVAYVVGLVQRWRREQLRELVHSQFVGFPRFLPQRYRSYLIEPGAVATVGAILFVARLSPPFGMYLWSVAAAMLWQFACLLLKRRSLVLDLRDSDIFNEGLRHIDPASSDPSAVDQEPSASREELMRLFSA